MRANGKLWMLAIALALGAALVVSGCKTPPLKARPDVPASYY